MAAQIGEGTVEVFEGTRGVGGVLPPLSSALRGHIATGVVTAIAIALLLRGLGMAGLTRRVPAGTVTTTTAW